MGLIAGLKELVREQREFGHPLVRRVARAATNAYRRFRDARAIVTDADRRTVMLLKILRPGDVHQTTALTWRDRYPDIFARCAQALQPREDVHLLSYGCSTGEEVLTLRDYFPAARITGAEINPRSLATCRRLAVDNRISFVESRTDIIRAHGPYDAIFCMAVLQRTPHAVESQGLTSLEDLYPFHRFNHQVAALDAVLRPGGLLIVHHSQYRFTDSDVATRYEPLDGVPVAAATTPYFDRRSSLIREPVFIGSIFVKGHD